MKKAKDNTGGKHMGYPIIFESKIVTLSDGRLIHFILKGCNNDNCGRNRDEFAAKIYTKNEFIKYAEKCKEESSPATESDGFDLKIGNRFCTKHDYGTHLLRMMKRTVPFDRFISERQFYGTVFDGVELHEKGKEMVVLKPDEWTDICYEFLYGNRRGKWVRLTHTIKTADEIIKALEENSKVEFFIGRKY